MSRHLLVLLLAALPAARLSGQESAPVASAAPDPSGESFRVRYRSASHVYLDAGGARGLAIGDRLSARDGGRVVAELEVAYVAQHSASCRIVSEKRTIREGDSFEVERRPAVPAPGAPATRPQATGVEAAVAPASAPPAPAAAGGRAKPRWPRLRLAASLGYYRAWDTSESDYDFEQRTARLALGLHDIGGRPLSFTLRASSRQDLRSRALGARTPQDERNDRLYELALRYEPPAGTFAIELGRVGVQRFVGVGYLDGGILRWRVRGGLQVGAFAGRIAEIEDLGLAGSGRRLGGFLRLAPHGRFAGSGLESTLAFVREDAAGEVSREYLSLESRFSRGGRLSLFERAELDVNRGWRRDLAAKGAQLTNVSLAGHLRLTETASAFASYDGRRNYRFHRNRVVPAEEFDDLLHQGLRAGLNWYRPRGAGASIAFGTSLKEKDPLHPELSLANAYSLSAGLRHDDVFSSAISIGLEGSGFSNGYTDGGIASLRIGRRFGAGHSLDLSYGQSLYRVAQTSETRTTRWLRLVGRVGLGRRIYVLTDLEYDAGDDRAGPRAFVEMGAVF